MIMTIFAGIAEFERDLIRERTGAGREAARKRGVRFGRPRKLSLDHEQLARRLVLEGKSAVAAEWMLQMSLGIVGIQNRGDLPWALGSAGAQSQYAKRVSGGVAIIFGILFGTSART